MRRLVSSLTLAAAFLLTTTKTYAVIPAYIAYNNVAGSGNQAFGGNLGLNFTVNSPGIVVTNLGAFNARGTNWGPMTTITVGIFTSTGTTPIVSATFNANEHGEPLLGDTADLFLIVTPTFLAPGNYIVVAVGFNATDMNGNETVSPFPMSTENGGPGPLITFTEPAAYDANTTLDNPNVAGGCGGCDTATNEFEAGTFIYTEAMPPTITKSFAAPKVLQLAGTNTLTFSLTSPNTPLTGLTFTDALPTGLRVATPNGLTGSCGAGTITATAGTTGIALAGASLAVGGSCTFSVNVTSTLSGTYNNTTGSVTDDQMLTGTASMDTLNVVTAPTISKSFSDTEIQLLGPGTWLNFSITNPSNNPISATGITFTDTLPAGLIVAIDTGAPVKGGCGGGTISAVPGSNTISLSGASLASGASCNFAVAVLADPLTHSPGLGTQSNTTGPIQAFPIPMTMPVEYLVTGGNASASVDVNFLEFLWFFLAGKG
jgi:hypothetical protein